MSHNDELLRQVQADKALIARLALPRETKSKQALERKLMTTKQPEPPKQEPAKPAEPAKPSVPVGPQPGDSDYVAGSRSSGR